MRPEKSTIVEDLSKALGNSPFLIVVDYTGLKVEHFAELRKRLAEAGAECHVVKNTMLRKALAQVGWPELAGCLRGQNAMITGPGDICAAAKAVKNFRAEFAKPEIKGGVLDRSALGADQLSALAELPPKDVLRGQLLALLLSPATKLVRVLNEPASSLARLLKAKAEKDGGGA